jgi:uncharacterized protein (TIGR03435 family)
MESENHDPTKDQMRLMMQSLLADRFKLVVHTDTRQVPVFASVLATFRRKIHFPEVTRRKDARAPAKRNPPRDRRGRLEKPDLEIRMEVNLD